MILLLSAVFLVFALVEWGVGEFLLLPRFEQIERDNATTAMRRIDAGVTLALDGLQVSATDWGNWADTFQFMQDHNQAYNQANLNVLGMKQLHITVLAFVDLSGKFIWSGSLDPVTSVPMPLDLFATGALPSDSPWLKNLREATPAHGLIATNHGVLLAAVAPILDGYGHGPSRGLVFMGRLLTNAEIAQIGAKAQTNVVPIAMRSTDRPTPAFLPAPAASGESSQIQTTPEMTQVYRVFRDILGQPIMSLRVDVPRTITANARTTVDSAMSFTIGAAVAALVFTLLALNRTIFSPLARVTRHAIATTRSPTRPSPRIQARLRSVTGRSGALSMGDGASAATTGAAKACGGHSTKREKLNTNTALT